MAPAEIVAAVVAGLVAGLIAALALVVSPARAAPGDAARGERLYARCLACHALAYDRVGPKHCGLIGRQAGAVPGFAYSESMKASGIVWDARTLDRFLADPLRAVRGTTMTYAGVPEARDRVDLIAYLARAGSTPATCGTAN